MSQSRLRGQAVLTTPLFPVPNFPSYPSNHSTFSAARSEVMAYLFPTRAGFIRAVGKEAGDSRIRAGIYYEMDNLAGKEWGRSVAQVFISRAQSDGSQVIADDDDSGDDGHGTGHGL
ncbi:MAG: hypothetical protein ACRD68_09400 [Pyrinomonadaceae bacterium]